MRRREILVLCGEPYPVRYGFIEHVFARLLPDFGLDSSWVMPTQDAEHADLRSWHGRPLRLVRDRRRFRPDGPASLPAFARSVARAAEASCEARRPDAVLVRNDLAMLAVGRRVARRYRVPFVVQLSHLIEETRIAYARQRIYGSPIKNRLLGTTARWARDRLLRQADLVFPISDAMARHLARRGIDPGRMVPLPEGVDTGVAPAEWDAAAREVRAATGVGSAPTLVYVGNMSRFREPEFLFAVLAEVRARGVDARLLMVGAPDDPNDLAWLRERAAASGVASSAVFVGQVPRDRVPAYVRAADVGLSPFPPNDVLSTNSPIKLLEYLAMEVPVVGTDIPEQRTVLEASGGGDAVPHDRDAYADAVVRLLEAPSEARARSGRAGRAWVARHRDYAVLADVAAGALRRTIDAHGRKEG